MKTDLRVLIINESEDDTSLLLHELERGGYNPIYERVDTAKAMEIALQKEKWNMIISDYSMPDFNAIKALEILKKTKADMPIIIVSDKAEDKTAAAVMKAGAQDYIFKNNLARLCPAIGRELQKVNERASYRATENALRESEAKLQAVFESITDGISVIDLETRKITYSNRAILNMCGYSNIDEVIGKTGFDFIAPRDRDRAVQQMVKAFSEEKRDHTDLTEYALLDRRGKEYSIEACSSMLRNSEGKPVSLVTIVRDISQRRIAEQERLQYLKRQENLLKIAQTVSQTFDLQELLQNAMIKVPEIMGVDASVVFLLDANAMQLTLSAYTGVTDTFVSNLGTIKLDEDELDKILQWYDATIRLENLLNEANFALVMKTVTQDKFQMFIIEPMWTGKRIHGAICIACRSARQITPNDMELLKAMSNQISIAIDNAYLYKDIEEKAKRLELIAAISMIFGSNIDINSIFETFAQGVKKLVSFDQANLALVDRNNLVYIAVSSNAKTEAVNGHTITLTSSAIPWLKLNKKPHVENDIYKEKQFPIDKTYLKEGMRSVISLPLFSKGEVFGAFNLLSQRSNAFGRREQEILQELASQIAVGIENNRLFTELNKRTKDLEMSNKELIEKTDYLEKSKTQIDSAYFNMAKTVVILSEARNNYSVNHSEHVADLCQRIATKMELSIDKIKLVETAASLLGLGNAKIPERILQKPGPLTPEERSELQKQQLNALDLLRVPSSLTEAVPILESMHEYFNGEGYPNKLKGEQIPIGARILAVADAYIAMISDRPYRPAMTEKQAIETLQQGVNKEWDPKVVTALLHVLK